MRCGICRVEIAATAYLVCRVRHGGDTLSVNLCTACARYLWGPAMMNRLDLILVKAGWIQEPLPE